MLHRHKDNSLKVRLNLSMRCIIQQLIPFISGKLKSSYSKHYYMVNFSIRNRGCPLHAMLVTKY